MWLMVTSSRNFKISSSKRLISSKMSHHHGGGGHPSISYWETELWKLCSATHGLVKEVVVTF